MILDGYWKKNLKSIIKQLKRWSGNRCNLCYDYAEHKVNQGLLYSAVIIRKIIEDEKDAKAVFDERHSIEQHLKTLFYDVPVQKFSHIDEKKFFVNSKLILSDYDLKNSEKTSLPMDKICNQFIHSYVWGIVHTSSQKHIYGVIMASNNFMKTEAYLLKIDDWIDTIRFMIDNSNI